jgi:holo-[acyl-carrier protein] synthase
VITGIGVDIIEVKRMERWLNNSSLLKRYFDDEEISLVLSRKKGASLALAVRFAAKEAFGKALGTGLAQIELKDIIVTNNDNGKPEMKLKGTAQKAFEKSGANKTHLSLTHERENAVAMIVLEGA